MTGYMFKSDYDTTFAIASEEKEESPLFIMPVFIPRQQEVEDDLLIAPIGLYVILGYGLLDTGEQHGLIGLTE